MISGTGAGFVIRKGRIYIHGEKFKLPDLSTVFQAEIMAIKKAALYLLENISFKYAKIFIDSQATIQALSEVHINSLIVY